MRLRCQVGKSTLEAERVVREHTKERRSDTSYSGPCADNRPRPGGLRSHGRNACLVSGMGFPPLLCPSVSTLNVHQPSLRHRSRILPMINIRFLTKYDRTGTGRPYRHLTIYTTVRSRSRGRARRLMTFISTYTRLLTHRTPLCKLYAWVSPSPRVRCLLACVTYLLTY